MRVRAQTAGAGPPPEEQAERAGTALVSFRTTTLASRSLYFPRETIRSYNSPPVQSCMHRKNLLPSS